MLKAKIYLGFIVNPFYLYCIAFLLAIIIYSWGWCVFFPKLSSNLLMFFLISFPFFIIAGYFLGKPGSRVEILQVRPLFLNDVIFCVIVFLGILNILIMGYLPILDRSNNYREFGAPVIDPLFNTMSIFFSVFYLKTFLYNKKRKYLVYILVILILQVLLFRRSTVIWIIVSSVFLLLLYYQRIRVMVVILCLICLPLFSFYFGLYGNFRSKLTKSFVINDLGASNSFKKTGISYNHYMTYLYISSPLANLQKNIDQGSGFSNNGDLKSFIFSCILPENLTRRLNGTLKPGIPECSLIHPELIVGTFLMASFCTMGWAGMIIMLFYVLIFSLICITIIRKMGTFQISTYCILSTSVFLLIFANFLTRLDVVLMLFVYPVVFNFLYTKTSDILLRSNLKG
jgi:hypothetical protein